uniref:L_3 protein n=1 Tax=Fopius arisanus TaxID=64838 RepID=A0A0C9QVK9_9HYME
MKYLGIGLLVVALAAFSWGAPEDHSRVKRIYDNELVKFLDVKLRKILREGNDTLSVPIIDPFYSKELPLEINQEKVKVNAVIKELHVDGLAGYIVDLAKISISGKVSFDLTFPEIKSTGTYSLQGVVMDGIDVYGDGEFQVSLKNFTIKTVIAVNIIGELKIKSINLKIGLGALDLKATGIFNDENTSILLSEIISDMAPELILDYHDQITTPASAYLVEIINVLLAGKSLKDLIGMLG